MYFLLQKPRKRGREQRYGPKGNSHSFVIGVLVKGNLIFPTLGSSFLLCHCDQATRVSNKGNDLSPFLIFVFGK